MTEPCGPGCQLRAADLEARQRYLDSQRKYNTSSKGQARNLAYERRHPERKLRWEPARNALHGSMPPAPDAPMHGGADLPPDTAVFGPGIDPYAPDERPFMGRGTGTERQ